MKHLADCLALAIVHIATRPPHSDDDEEDDDVRVLESIAADIQGAPADEIAALLQSSKTRVGVSIIKICFLIWASIHDAWVSQRDNRGVARPFKTGNEAPLLIDLQECVAERHPNPPSGLNPSPP